MTGHGHTMSALAAGPYCITYGCHFALERVLMSHAPACVLVLVMYMPLVGKAPNSAENRVEDKALMRADQLGL